MNVKWMEFTAEEKAVILAARKEPHPVHVSKRLLALKLKAIQRMRSDEAGKIAELHTTNINRIVSRFKKEGIESIVGVRHHHEHRYMSREQEEAFLGEFQDLSAAGQVIEVKAIHWAYEERVGYPVSRNMIYYLLQRHKWRKVMPRSRHEKKASNEAIEAYKKTTEKIKILKKAQPKLSVMVQDEAGFGRINKPKCCRCRKGIRPTAAWHHSSMTIVPDNIELYPLLAYTPELNPIEMIWDEVREKGFRNEIFKSLEAVLDILCARVKELAEDSRRVASITHREWLINALTFLICLA